VVGVSASVVFPCTIKCRRFLLALSDPDSSGIKGRKMLVCVFVRDVYVCVFKSVSGVTWFCIGINQSLSQLVVRKLKKKDKLKSDGNWECEIGQDWSSRRNVEPEGISESAGNVCDFWNCCRSCIMSVLSTVYVYSLLVIIKDVY